MATFFYFAVETNSITVTSGGDKKRIGGPQVPVPRLTYKWFWLESVKRPLSYGKKCFDNQAEWKNLALVRMAGQLQVEKPLGCLRYPRLVF